MSKENRLRIVVVDREEELGLRIKEIFEGLTHYACTVQWSSALVIDEVKGAHCVVIDSRMVKDVKNLIEVLRALSVNKIVITTNELNHPISSTALTMGAAVFYRHSPITTLLPKIIENFYPEKLARPISSPQGRDAKETSAPLGTSVKLTRGKGYLESDRQKFVMFYSPKGGVGKTSILLNCALHLAKKNLKVLVIDYSLFGSIRIKLKIDMRNPGLSSILPALKNPQTHKNFDSIIRSNIFTYTFADGTFDVLTSDHPVAMSNLKVETVEYLNNIIHTLNYDLVLMDTSSDLSRLNMALFEMSNDIILVTDPDISATWSLIQHKELMHNLNLMSRCKVVLNGFGPQYGFLPNELESELEYPLITVIPENPAVRTLENQGSFLSLTPQDAFNFHYRQVAHAIFPIFGAEDIVVPKKKFSLNPFKKS